MGRAHPPDLSPRVGGVLVSGALPTTTMSSISSSNAAAASFGEGDVHDEPTALARLLEVSTAILRQGVDLVENRLTSDDQLTTQSNYIPGSTIGMSFDPVCTRLRSKYPSRQAPQACQRPLCVAARCGLRPCPSCAQL